MIPHNIFFFSMCRAVIHVRTLWTVNTIFFDLIGHLNHFDTARPPSLNKKLKNVVILTTNTLVHNEVQQSSINSTLSGKCLIKAVTSAVPFQKVQICTF